jgi:hypothetical protein
VHNKKWSCSGSNIFWTCEWSIGHRKKDGCFFILHSSKSLGIGEYNTYELHYVSVLYTARHTAEASGAYEPWFCFMKIISLWLVVSVMKSCSNLSAPWDRYRIFLHENYKHVCLISSLNIIWSVSQFFKSFCFMLTAKCRKSSPWWFV